MSRRYEGVSAEPQPALDPTTDERSLGLAAVLLVAAFVVAACSLAIAHSDFLSQFDAERSTATEQLAETRGAVSAAGGVITFGLGALAWGAATGRAWGTLRTGALWLCGAAGSGLLFSGHFLLAAVMLLAGSTIVLTGAIRRRSR